ncbi:odorant receptor 94a-like isoform X1 [Linepithema humile]|uniref:odorant receptor 94a-like isoform X1 n=1 Tax=Linepithema humile TaxID=83485 RepID=UPI00351DF825
MRILMQEKLVKELIRALNNFMRIKDTMKDNIIERNLKPMKIPFRFYLVMGVPSVFVYCGIPFLLAFEKSSFYYVDFKMPAIFFKEPFSIGLFMVGNTMVLIANIYIFIKKVSVDVYITYLIALITAQYQYIATKLVLIFQDDNPQNNYASLSKDFEINSAERKIRILCRQHTSVIRITLMLRKLMSLSFSLIYVNNVFRFCFLGIMLTRISVSLVEGFMVCMYGSGALVQFYILCSSVQKLLEASTEITDKAFHEDWNRFKVSVKRTFMLMMMASNNLEIKLAAFEKFSLSLPSFITVLNQAYSFALLILRVN